MEDSTSVPQKMVWASSWHQRTSHELHISQTKIIYWIFQLPHRTRLPKIHNWWGLGKRRRLLERYLNKIQNRRLCQSVPFPLLAVCIKQVLSDEKKQSVLLFVQQRCPERFGEDDDKRKMYFHLPQWQRILQWGRLSILKGKSTCLIWEKIPQ